jgi:hypothetical protein
LAEACTYRSRLKGWRPSVRPNACGRWAVTMPKAIFTRDRWLLHRCQTVSQLGGIGLCQIGASVSYGTPIHIKTGTFPEGTPHIALEATFDLGSVGCGSEANGAFLPGTLLDRHSDPWITLNLFILPEAMVRVSNMRLRSHVKRGEGRELK